MKNYKNVAIYRLSQLARKVGYDFNAEKDSRVIQMHKVITDIGGRINFDIEVSDEGDWVAESSSLGSTIITGGKNYSPKNAREVMKDAIFTYFDIPPHLCEESLLRGAEEPITVKQKVYA
jgi:hypothetical protein